VEDLRPEDPRQVGAYQLLRRLGSGGMGRVYLGRSPGGRLVAVKVIRPDLAGSTDFRRRFAREIAAARRVSGIFTASVVDADPDAAVPWLVTAYVDGPSLADVVAGGGPLPAVEVTALARSLAEGLAAIHAAGVVHRDLKPSNVLLAADGPRIIDFGISRAADATALTSTGLVVGSPGFMSPEQAMGRPVDPASDMFSLGSVLAFAATGREPFGTGVPSALLYRVVHADPALDGLPPGIRAVVTRCLSKEPAARPTPAELLARLAHGEPVVSAAGGEGTLAPGSATSVMERVGAHVVERVSAPPAAETPHVADAPPAADAPHAADAPQWAEARPAAEAPPGRLRRPAWIGVLGAALLLVAVAAGAWFALHRTPAAAGRSAQAPRVTSVSPAGPRAVVADYYAAINAHDWPRVWRLGGKNLGQSYSSLVAGFSLTSHDVITYLAAQGDKVEARIRAYETTGTVQVYAVSYAVSDGVITAGQQNLLATRPAAGPPAHPKRRRRPPAAG
jgi:hypothetical protein